MIVKVSLVKQDFVGQKAYCLLRIFAFLMEIIWFGFQRGTVDFKNLCL